MFFYVRNTYVLLKIYSEYLNENHRFNLDLMLKYQIGATNTKLLNAP